jgi:hypothetical protein
MQYQWRVSKYDPGLRADPDLFLDDWTSVSDIGDVYRGQVLSLATYLAMEDRYVAAAMSFMRESDVSSLMVVDIEHGQPPAAQSPADSLNTLLAEGEPLREGSWLSGPALERACRLNLRELLWCKLEDPGSFFIHFGYDYYMYLGSDMPCQKSVRYAEGLGLFVEPMRSPYAPDKQE